MPFERLSPYRYARSTAPTKPPAIVRAIGIVAGAGAVTALRALALPELQHSVLIYGLSAIVGAVAGWFAVTAIPHLWRMARSGVRQDRARMDAIFMATEARSESMVASGPRTPRPTFLDLGIYVEHV
jgi:hypothetical protein